MSYKDNIWKLYVIQFFQSLIPAYVIERLFWEARGMTIQMVVYTEILYAATVVLLEVPMGIMADKWSRKNMLVLSAILLSSMFLILVIATEFWHFAIAIFLAGIARSASSGSENALLYDTLLLVGKEQEFEKILGRLNTCSIAAAIIAALSGSLLANRFNYELNYWISLISLLISVGATLLLVEPAVKSDSDEVMKISAYIRISVQFFKRHPGVSVVVLTGMVTGSALSFLYEFWQLYLDRLEVPIVYFGLCSAAFMALSIPGNILAHTLRKRFSYRILLCGVSAVFAAGFMYISLVKDLTSLVAILLIFLFSGIVEPLTAGYLHHRIDSTMRATIESFQSLGTYVVLIIAGLGFGYFSSEYDIFGGYGFIAVMCMIFFAYYLMVSKRIE